MQKAALGAAGKTGEAAPELGIMRVCQHHDPADCGMRIASQDSVRARPSWDLRDPHARVLALTRRSKKRPAHLRAYPARVVRPQAARRIRDLGCGDLRIYLEVEVRRVACWRCGQVKQERLAFLADNPCLTTQGDPSRASKILPRIHRVFGNLHTWLRGTHHGVGHPHLQPYLDEFAFRFNRRRTPMAAFQTLLGLGSQQQPTTYKQLYGVELNG